MKHLQPLLQKEMTRKEFMATLGFGMLSIMGLSTIMRLLTGTDPTAQLDRHMNTNKASFGYGGGPYSK